MILLSFCKLSIITNKEAVDHQSDGIMRSLIRFLYLSSLDLNPNDGQRGQIPQRPAQCDKCI